MNSAFPDILLNQIWILRPEESDFMSTYVRIIGIETNLPMTKRTEIFYSTECSNDLISWTKDLKMSSEDWIRNYHTLWNYNVPPKGMYEFIPIISRLSKVY